MVRIIIFILISLGLTLGILLIKGDSGQVSQENKSVQSPTVTPKVQAQTNSEGEVTVEVTPIVLSEKENIQFKVILNTHSVALDKDLKDISILFDDQNNQYQPISWSGGTGGHHLEGALTFPKIQENTKSVRLIIKGISGVDREFLFLL